MLCGHFRECQTIMNIMKSSIGTGILALPSALSHGGLFVSMIKYLHDFCVLFMYTAYYVLYTKLIVHTKC